LVLFDSLGFYFQRPVLVDNSQKDVLSQALNQRPNSFYQQYASPSSSAIAIATGTTTGTGNGTTATTLTMEGIGSGSGVGGLKISSEF